MQGIGVAIYADGFTIFTQVIKNSIGKYCRDSLQLKSKSVKSDGLNTCRV